MNQWSLFKRSWSIFWRNPLVWLFGFLGALGGGGLSGLVSISNINNLQPIAQMPLGLTPRDITAWLGANFSQILIATVALSAIAFVIHTFAESGLISVVESIDSQKQITLGQSLAAAGRKFFPLLAVRIILLLPVLILGALVTGSFLTIFLGIFDQTNDPRQILASSFFANFGMMFALIIVINILNVLTTGISISAKRAVVLENTTIFKAIAHGWRLMWRRIGDYIVITLILVLAGLLISALIFALLAPMMFSSLTQTSIESNGLGFGASFIGTFGLIEIVINLILGTFISAFVSGIWTLAYPGWRISYPLKPVAPNVS